MIRLKCLRCGLTVAHKESASELCPRCLARDEQAVRLLAVSDQPAVTTGRSMGRLRINTEVQGSRHTIMLSGELDIASVQILDETLAEACSKGATEMNLDLGGIEFMDSTGLGSILRGRTLCEEHNCTYFLTPAQRPVQRMFAITGIAESLSFRKGGSRTSESDAAG